MYEDYYGLAEKPFSLTPDPKYFFKSASHASAFDLLQYAIRRREGLTVVTGDIGTGKTMLCRALLERLDGKTFTSRVLNPSLADEDLFGVMLRDFGIVSRRAIRRNCLQRVPKQELVDTLGQFLRSLQPLGARAMLVIDEAQNLPHQVLEHIRILSNLETDTDKLLQIVLVGQSSLRDMLRTPELRQLHQRVSGWYELRPLTAEESGAYVMHRLSVAGGRAAVSFSSGALTLIHRFSGGIPRLINLVCDRALRNGSAAWTDLILPEHVTEAAESLDLAPRRHRTLTWVRTRFTAVAAGARAAALAALGAAALR